MNNTQSIELFYKDFSRFVLRREERSWCSQPINRSCTFFTIRNQTIAIRKELSNTTTRCNREKRSSIKELISKVSRPNSIKLPDFLEKERKSSKTDFYILKDFVLRLNRGYFYILGKFQSANIRRMDIVYCRTNFYSTPNSLITFIKMGTRLQSICDVYDFEKLFQNE